MSSLKTLARILDRNKGVLVGMHCCANLDVSPFAMNTLNLQQFWSSVYVVNHDANGINTKAAVYAYYCCTLFPVMTHALIYALRTQ